MKKWRGDPEYHRTELKFQKTSDIAFAAIEIGRWYARGAPDESKPLWALEACSALYERAAADLAPVVTRIRGRKPFLKDYARIAWVANCHLHGDQKSARALFELRLNNEGAANPKSIEADLRRLLNYYGPIYPSEGGVTNRHIERAAKRHARARKVKELGLF